MNKIISHKIVVGAIIINRNKALIVQRSQDEDVGPGLWEIPGGKVESSETLEDALIREVQEETALDIVPLKVSGDFNYQVVRDARIRQTKQINFLAKAKNIDKLKLSSEHQDYKWIKVEEIDNFDISHKTKMAIRQAFDQLASLL